MKSIDFSTLLIPLMSFVAGVVGYLAGTKKRRKEGQKLSTETDSAILDLRIRENLYEAEKYEKLFSRVKDSDCIIEKLIKENETLILKVSEQNTALEKAKESIRELMSELTLYKTIN